MVDVVGNLLHARSHASIYLRGDSVYSKVWRSVVLVKKVFKKAGFGKVER